MKHITSRTQHRACQARRKVRARTASKNLRRWDRAFIDLARRLARRSDA